MYGSNYFVYLGESCIIVQLSTVKLVKYSSKYKSKHITVLPELIVLIELDNFYEYIHERD